MSLPDIDLQLACAAEGLPDLAQLTQWVGVATEPLQNPVELTIRIVDSDESEQLNHCYRGLKKPTNVLSFPFDVPEGIDLNLLGDLVICAPVVAREAGEQHKPLLHHWAHMVIHGTLHLLGHDHVDDNEAAAMEALEIQLLKQLGIPDPYAADLRGTAAS